MATALQVRRPIKGGVIFWDKVSTGVSKQWLTPNMGGGTLGASSGGGGELDIKKFSPPDTSPVVRPKRYLLYNRILDFHRQLVHNLIHDDNGIDRYA